MESYTSEVRCSTTEWANQLILRVSPHIIHGFQSIFKEAVELCETNNEPTKYLMTYQNLLSRIPHWNQTIIDNEKNRIINKSGCSYLEDLITCIHVNQLRLLSYARAGSEPQKIEINIPEFSLFLHRVYINIARKLYSNIYLFEIDISSLEHQKRNREFEVLVESCIMNTIRDNLPIEELLRKYIDETQEIDVKKEEIEVKDTEKIKVMERQKEEQEKEKLKYELSNISTEPPKINSVNTSSDDEKIEDEEEEEEVEEIPKEESLRTAVIDLSASTDTDNEDSSEKPMSSDVRLSWAETVKDNEPPPPPVDFNDMDEVDLLGEVEVLE